ncbi:OmpA family protein [Lysobacter sp. S4-A87]|uniref:OmpA family protein n=1 Tax=Lysobacter sp. S4-A87 TaxID=2925843 RepID=UPI001F5384FD|nr:OmpA family protein [Lysobacter sp. S4-A87]UNK50124.1 OmpA family protein [Lysobacter sp. S4-A87]
MITRTFRNAGLVVALSAVGLAGCSSYIKREEFDSTIADLRATDQKLQSQIDSLSQKHDALVTQLAGRVRVETGAHFATGDATLNDQDKPLLDDFARVVKESHSDALITVEGFTDPAGSAAANRRLGLQRAQAVRDYLVSSGLGAEQVRAVSYGEDQNRQVRAGAVGEGGRDNRRVSLVVDYAGVAQQNAAAAPETSG